MHYTLPYSPRVKAHKKMYPVLHIVVNCLAIGSAIAYENAYDLLERRNRRLQQPYYHSLYDSQYFTAVGNGYDNLGYGIPVRRPFRQHFTNGWRSFDRRPFRERTFNDFRFQNFGHQPPRYVGYRMNEYFPVHHRNVAPSGGVYRKSELEMDRFLEENEDKKQKKADEVFQRSQEGVKMDSAKEEKLDETVRADQMGENKSSVRSNKVVKKGRTTKGFAVHHHKDETGNSTTYFDESSDFGGQSDLRDFTDGFGTKKTLEQIVHKGDEKYFKENGGQTANFGSDLFLGNQKFHKDFSSLGDNQETGGRFHGGSHNNVHVGIPKTYRYLNGDPFEYTEPDIDNYY